MNLNMSGHHLEVTPAIRAYLSSKLQRIRRHFDHVLDAHVIFSVEKLQQKAEITLHVRGREIHVESRHADLYSAIDLLMDKLDRQIMKYKQQAGPRNHVPFKRQDAAIEALSSSG